MFQLYTEDEGIHMTALDDIPPWKICYQPLPGMRGFQIVAQYGSISFKVGG